jgi:hypothetical protein
VKTNNPDPFNSLVDASRKLIFREKNLAAETSLRQAEEGGAAAMVELAYAMDSAGRPKLSDAWIAAAEAQVELTDDHDGRCALVSAYKLGYGGPRLGIVELRDWQDQRAIYHLEKLASDGNRFAAGELADWYKNGYNGCPVDPTRAKYWKAKALET